MKKLLIATNILFLTTAIFFGCDPKDKIVEAECDHCPNYSNQKFEGIPAGLGYDMIKNYKTDHWDNYRVPNLRNQPITSTSPTDARSVWFSLDTLKKFIWNLEQDVCNNKCVNKNDLGLRFYYADYPDETTWAQMDNPISTDPVEAAKTISHKNKYQYLHTVVITPTYYSTNAQMNVDFDPRYVSNTKAGCSPTSMQQVFNLLGVKFDKDRTATNGGLPAFMLSPDIETSAKNKGSLIPPPPPFNSNIGEGNGAVIFDLMQGQLFAY